MNVFREGVRVELPGEEHDAFGTARQPRTSTVIDQSDREPVQPGPRDRTTGATLVGRHDGAALERGWRARS
jgi:hypothetical protein